MLLVGLTVFLIGLIIKINYHYDRIQYQSQYYISSAVLFAGSLIAEASAIAMLAKTISPSLKKGLLTAGVISAMADILGKTIGNGIYAGFESIDTIKSFCFYWYIVASSLLAICLVLCLFFLDSLRSHCVIILDQPLLRTINTMDVESSERQSINAQSRSASLL